jgi:hypothetical protein
MTSPQWVFKGFIARDLYEHAHSSFSHRGKRTFEELLNSRITSSDCRPRHLLTADQSNWDSIMSSALRAALSSDRQVSLSRLSWGSKTITSRIQRESSRDNARVITLFSCAILEIDARVKGALPRRPKVEAGEMPWMSRFCSSVVSVTRLMNDIRARIEDRLKSLLEYSDGGFSNRGWKVISQVLAVDGGIFQVRLSMGLWSYSYPPCGMEKGKAEIDVSWGPTMRFSLEKESRDQVSDTVRVCLRTSFGKRVAT